jgi:membrane protein
MFPRDARSNHPMKRIWEIAKGSVKAFLRDDAMSLAAAVAFYTALSFAPLVLLLVAVGGLLGESAQNDLISFLNQQIGPRAGEVTEAVVENAESEDPDRGFLRSAFSTVMLFVSASAVFGQLQASLNHIWRAEARVGKPGWWEWVRRRLLSLGMVLAILFVLLVALVLSALMGSIVPGDAAIPARLGVEFTSFAVATLLFAAIFKILPDTPIAWREVWLGAAITAALFTVGKFAVGIYMERSGVGVNYGGTAGSMIALLLWVYYSCIILFFGAEVTESVARLRRGEPEKPPVDAPAV